jgi:butyryl-CoA dehydrogenase
MNFDPTQEQKRWRNLAYEYAREEIKPRAARLDKEQKFPYDIVAEMARLGFMGMTIPKEYGGSGGDFVAYNLALEEICRADTSVGITMEAHVSLGCSPFVAFGTPEQKEYYLGEVIRGGERLWAFGLTEENAGTDAGGTQTTAELKEGRWVVNGSKKWITNSGTDLTGGVTAIARTGTRENDKPELTAIIIPQDTPGYTRGPGYEKTGWRASDQRPCTSRTAACRRRTSWASAGAASCSSCRRSTADGSPSRRSPSGWRRRAWTRRSNAPGSAGSSAGLSRVPGHTVQAGGHGDGDRAGKNMVLKAAWLKDQDRSFGREASMAKVFASETAKRAADQAIQIHGGEGFMETSAGRALLAAGKDKRDRRGDQRDQPPDHRPQPPCREHREDEDGGAIGTRRSSDRPYPVARGARR